MCVQSEEQLSCHFMRFNVKLRKELNNETELI